MLGTQIAARKYDRVRNRNHWNVYSSMVTHPYSIHIWHAAHGVRGQPTWYEALQAYTEDDALYTANLIHMDSQAIIEVVRFGLNPACFPDEHTVTLCERQIAQQQKREREEEARWNRKQQ